MEISNKITSKAKSLQFSKQQKQEIMPYIEKLQKQSLYAIRSSSPEEDLESASFAGMYETHLAISVDKIESMVVSVFSSAFDFRVMKYKNQHSIDLSNTNIAVIIQQQII